MNAKPEDTEGLLYRRSETWAPETGLPRSQRTVGQCPEQDGGTHLPTTEHTMEMNEGCRNMSEHDGCSPPLSTTNDGPTLYDQEKKATCEGPRSQ